MAIPTDCATAFLSSWSSHRLSLKISERMICTHPGEVNLGQGQAGKRGGSWNNNPRNCRSAYRNNNNPRESNNNIGFRVVCSAPSTLRNQNWPMGIGRACLEESRPAPAMLALPDHPKINQKWLAW